MKLPSEDQILAVFSELEVSQGSHKEGHGDDCELCQLNKHFTKWGTESIQKDGVDAELPCIDKIGLDIIDRIPVLGMICTAQPDYAAHLIYAARTCFLIGLKVGRNQEANEKLAAAFGEN